MSRSCSLLQYRIKYRACTVQAAPTFQSTSASSRSISRNSAIAKGLRESHQSLVKKHYVARYKFETVSSGVKDNGQDPEASLNRDNRNLPSEQKHASYGNNGTVLDQPSSHSVASQTNVKNPKRNELRRQDANNASRDMTKAQVFPEAIPYTTASSVFIVGIRAAAAAMNAGRRKCYMLYVRETLISKEKSHSLSITRKAALIQQAKSRDIPIKEVNPHFFQLLAHEAIQSESEGLTNSQNGVILEASNVPVPKIVSLGNVYDREEYSVVRARSSNEDSTNVDHRTNFPFASNSRRQPFIIWLHGVVDSNNAGAIIRTAMYFGADAVLLSNRKSASLSPGTLRASVGAAEYMQCLMVDQHPLEFMRASQANGWKFIASVAPAKGADAALPSELNYSLADHPTVLIMGPEFSGLEKGIVDLADQHSSITGRSKLAETADVGSLNVSVAAALLMERLLKRPTYNGGEVNVSSNSERLF